MSKNTFASLKLRGWLVRRLETVGIKEPTPIQLNCIGPILDGRDCIGAAKTGSGKTLAFALPILQKLSDDPYGIFALVLTPTRELAYQIKDTFEAVGVPINIRTCVIVGGMEMVAQGLELSRKPHIVIATPGRLKDHLESCNTFSLSRIKFLVLDEADRLLGGGYDDQISAIIAALPSSRQTLCFSATASEATEALKRATVNAFHWEEGGPVATVSALRQQMVLCPAHAKDGYLVVLLKEFLEENPRGLAILFADTCRGCQTLSVALTEINIDNIALHGQMSQRKRLQALGEFRTGRKRILVATDVASRGLDIPAVELVMSESVPAAAANYVHRVGRTARAGRAGSAVTLVSPPELERLRSVEAAIGSQFSTMEVDDREVAAVLTQVTVARRKAEVELDLGNFGERKENWKRKNMILEGKDPESVLSDILLTKPRWRPSSKKKKKKTASS